MNENDFLNQYAQEEQQPLISSHSEQRLSSKKSKLCDVQYYKLLQELQAIDFTLLELNLYLDTHPKDYKILEQYNSCAQQRMKLADEFQLKYGPLQNFGHFYSQFPWEWSQAPWPWQV